MGREQTRPYRVVGWGTGITPYVFLFCYKLGNYILWGVLYGYALWS